jgi:hypothetical protein
MTYMKVLFQHLPAQTKKNNERTCQIIINLTKIGAQHLSNNSQEHYQSIIWLNRKSDHEVYTGNCIKRATVRGLLRCKMKFNLTIVFTKNKGVNTAQTKHI